MVLAALEPTLVPFSWFVSVAIESFMAVSCFWSEDSAAACELRYCRLFTMMYALAYALAALAARAAFGEVTEIDATEVVPISATVAMEIGRASCRERVEISVG